MLFTYCLNNHIVYSFCSLSLFSLFLPSPPSCSSPVVFIFLPVRCHGCLSFLLQSFCLSVLPMLKEPPIPFLLSSSIFESSNQQPVIRVFPGLLLTAAISIPFMIYGPLEAIQRFQKKYKTFRMFLDHIWVWVNTYRYIFSGMNIHLPAILGFTRYQGFDPSPFNVNPG